MTPDFRSIAHAALGLVEPPYLKYYRNGRHRLWNTVALIGSDLPGPGFNFAAVLDDHSPPLDAILPVAREFFAGSTHGWGILVEGDAGHPMEAEVRSRGWKVDEDEPAFVIDLVGAGELPREESNLSVRIVRNRVDLDAYKEITSEAFEAPPETAESFMPTLAMTLDPEIALFVGAAGGVDVSGIFYSRHGETAVLSGTATLRSYRGRGYGAAVSRAALTHAAASGCSFAALRSGPKSVPLYERLGFRYVCQHRTYAFPG